MRHPFCMTATPLRAYQKRTGGAILGGTLEISYASTLSSHHRVSMFAVKIGIFYMYGVP